MESSVRKSKKYHRVTSSHISYSKDDLKNVRKEFNALKSKLQTGKLSVSEQQDYDRMRLILAHYGVKV